MESDGLPSPSSGLFLEVSFRRLLASCEDIVAGRSLARPDLVGCWQRSPVFHHYVETLQEQLADLEAAAGSRLPGRTLELYGQHVERLAAQLLPPDMPAFCASVAAPPAPGVPGGVPRLPVALPRPAAVVPPVPMARNPQQPGAAQPQGGAEQRGAAGPAAAAAAAAAAPAGPAAPAERQPESRAELLQASPAAGAAASGGRSARLQTQAALHEDLAGELVGLAAGLKTNTLALEAKLRERAQLLDGTEAALDTSVQKTKDSKEKATQIHRRSRANFCLTCLVMLIVGLVFAGMYLFIRMTRLAGYKAYKAAPLPPPAAPLPPPPPDVVPAYEEHYAQEL